VRATPLDAGLCGQQSRLESRSAHRLRAVLERAQTIKPEDISEEDANRFVEAGYTVRSAVYGTLPERNTADLFEAVRAITQLEDVDRFLKGGTFLDLGSGEGELVANALRLHPGLAGSVGVELCGERHRTAEARAAALPDDLRSKIDYIEADICDAAHEQVVEAIASARVIFVGSVMFETPLMECLSSLLHDLVARRGRAAVVLSFGKQLDLGGRPTATRSGLLTGSWGLAPLYVYGLLPDT